MHRRVFCKCPYLAGSYYLEEEPNVGTCCFKIAFRIQGNIWQRRLIMEPELGLGGGGDAHPLSLQVSSVDPLELDKLVGRLYLPCLCHGIRLTHNIHEDQKSCIASAVPSISWQFSGSFTAIYFQINTQLRRGRFTPLPISRWNYGLKQ